MWVVMIYNDKMKGRKATKCPVSLWNCVALKSVLYMNTGLYFLQNAQLGRSMIWLVQDKSNLKISHLIKMRPSSKKKFIRIWNFGLGQMLICLIFTKFVNLKEARYSFLALSCDVWHHCFAFCTIDFWANYLYVNIDLGKPGRLSCDHRNRIERNWKFRFNFIATLSQ